jgi:hypothetical protein
LGIDTRRISRYNDIPEKSGNKNIGDDYMTKLDVALKTLRKGRWVSRDVLTDALNDDDLRSVRRLREKGYNISVRRGRDGNYEYRRA